MRTHDYDYAESEMDERESLYFDTISLAESEAAAVAAAHRKSLSQSRNTIYHSAVDLAGDEGRNSMRLASGGIPVDHMRMGWQPGYRQSTALEHLNGAGGDHTDAAIAAQVLALQNGRTHLPTGIGVGSGGIGGGGGAGGGGGNGYGRSVSGGVGGGDDEVSRRLLRQSSTVSNKDKKLPITYSQWKLRVNNRIQQHTFYRSTIYEIIQYTRSTQHIENNNYLYICIYSLSIIDSRLFYTLYIFSNAHSVLSLFLLRCIHLSILTNERCLALALAHSSCARVMIIYRLRRSMATQFIALAHTLSSLHSHSLLVALLTPFGFSCICAKKNSVNLKRRNKNKS